MGAGRFAPSPTGELHLGNLRTALLAWLFARLHGDRFLVRFEDLDPSSVREQFYAGQLADLVAVGLEPDAPPVCQSDRVDLYTEALGALERAGSTYPCWCSRREIREAASAPNSAILRGAYPGTCRRLAAAARRERERSGRPPAIRLRTDRASLTVVDEQSGEFVGPVDDVVLRRGDGVFAYNLAVVVDDADQGITRVVRGDDLLPSTPRHVYLMGRLGLPVPVFAHVPLVLGSDGARLAKRHGSVTLADRLAIGESPARVLGRLAASLGLGDEPEPSVDELLVAFDPVRLPRQPWVWTDDWPATGDRRNT